MSRPHLARVSGPLKVSSTRSTATNEVLAGVFANPGEHGAITVKAHSPVALHAWDEEGRHVGWNATTDLPDVQIAGANYTGAPGGAQELTLPSGFYKVATVEIGSGRYTLNSGWNGTAGEGFELLPLQSREGRTLVSNYLLDHLGLFVGPAQRIATHGDAPFAFVETWRPLSSDAVTGAGSAPGVPEERGGPADAPGAGIAFVLAAAVILAAMRRRG